MARWKEFRLENVADVNKRSLNNEFSYTQIEYIDTSSVTQNKFENPVVMKLDDAPSRAKRLINPGDTILSTVRPIQRHYGFVNDAKPNTVVSTGFAVVSPNKIDPKFLYYFLTQDEITEYLNAIAESGTTTFPAFRAEELNGLSIYAPEKISDQAEIAEMLSSLDDKIELNNQINKELEALAQALFKHWFIDFEFPISKEEAAAMGKPKLEGKPYRSSGGKMGESELGEIPKGWKSGVLSDVIDFNPSERLSHGDVAQYLDMSSLPTESSWPMRPIPRAFGSGMKFRNGDTLFARITPCLENGKTAFVQCLYDNEIAWGSTEFVVMRPKEPWPKVIGYIIAREQNFREFAIQNMVGTSGRQRVQSSLLESYPFSYPKNALLIKSYANTVVPLFEVIKNNAQENENLASLRDALLPRLISGELKITK